MPVELYCHTPTKKSSENPRKAANLTFGRRLAELYTLRGMNQRRIAAVAQFVVANYEIGEVRLPVVIGLRFAAALDVPIQDLLRTDTPTGIVHQRKLVCKVLERLEKIGSLTRRNEEAILISWR